MIEKFPSQADNPPKETAAERRIKKLEKMRVVFDALRASIEENHDRYSNDSWKIDDLQLESLDKKPHIFMTFKALNGDNPDFTDKKSEARALAKMVMDDFPDIKKVLNVGWGTQSSNLKLYFGNND
jgi:hypothetical protein